MNDKGEYADPHQNESAYLVQALRFGLTCLMEYVLLLPAWILFASFLRPPELPVAGLGLLPLLSLAGVLLGTRLRKLWQRGAAALAFGAVYTAAAFAWAGGASALGFGNAASAGQTPALASTVVALLQTVALFAAGVFCSLQGLTVRNRQRHFRLYWVGLGLYFLAGIFFPRIEALQATVPLITWAGVINLATALFVTNHQFLCYSSQSGDSGERLPAGLRRHNRLFVGVIVVAALLLAAGVGRWIGSLLWRLLQAIVRWLTRPQEPVLPPTEEPEAVTPPQEPMLPAEPQEPGLLSEILNYAFYVFGGLLLAALLGFVLYWLYKNAGGYWRKAISRLLNLLRRESAAPEPAAYRDEETSLLTWESALQGWRRIGARLLRTGKPAERWEDMRDNRERVRFLYRLFLRKERQRGVSLKPYLTPKELVEEIKLEAAVDPLLQLYYETRYGEELPGDEEVAELRRRLAR
ncbi:DUF4129 domain-containing protein [Paenibacillus phoenicis]|uniref:DUF4129 domain-containing protein n=1 Tax=Paenibacillus phoenicis TaxID=554117 RepID=A0ABU5PQQ0_9BACL|nr:MULTISPECIES: DUF4129 domain-containing protein [Paenibacillus]EES74152.1 hypothetical protein POTG_01202 [Paenibacillus sp. oral taxon 786 str. D14]MCT2194947.1 DUF4129 domain-containing protein [Paenibacillus sp. p3-SID1389]MEA3572243.1 DUF4129 domain-containing protein [Paenibacillus phoenicis]